MPNQLERMLFTAFVSETGAQGRVLIFYFQTMLGSEWLQQTWIMPDELYRVVLTLALVLENAAVLFWLQSSKKCSGPRGVAQLISKAMSKFGSCLKCTVM